MSARAVLYTDSGYWWLRMPGSPHPYRTGHTDRMPAERIRGIVSASQGVEVDVQIPLDLDLPEVVHADGLFAEVQP